MSHSLPLSSGLFIWLHPGWLVAEKRNCYCWERASQSLISPVPFSAVLNNSTPLALVKYCPSHLVQVQVETEQNEACWFHVVSFCWKRLSKWKILVVSQNQVLLISPLSFSEQKESNVCFTVNPLGNIRYLLHVLIPCGFLYCRLQPKIAPFLFSHQIKQNGCFHLGLCKPLHEQLLRDPLKTFRQKQTHNSTSAWHQLSHGNLHFYWKVFSHLHIGLKFKTTAEAKYT